MGQTLDRQALQADGAAGEGKLNALIFLTETLPAQVQVQVQQRQLIYAPSVSVRKQMVLLFRHLP